MKRIVVENLRSAYNVGNIVRTADALWRWTIFIGYTARPDHKEVKKTALGAELHIPTMEFQELEAALYYMNTHGIVIVAELTEESTSLNDIHTKISEKNKSWGDTFLIVGNEVTGVEEYTISKADIIVHIPMLGIKESLNVGQAAAIIMWELSK